MSDVEIAKDLKMWLAARPTDDQIEKASSELGKVISSLPEFSEYPQALSRVLEWVQAGTYSGCLQWVEIKIEETLKKHESNL